MGKRGQNTNTDWKVDKILHQNHESFTCEPALIKFSWLNKYKLRKNNATSKKHMLTKRAKKLKNILQFIISFQNFPLELETGWTTRLV